MSTIVLPQSVCIALQETHAALELLFGKKVRIKDSNVTPDKWESPAYVPDEHWLRRVEVTARFKVVGDDTLHRVAVTIVVSTHKKSNSDSHIDYYARHRLVVDMTAYRVRWQAPGVLALRPWDRTGDWQYSQDYMKPEPLSDEEAAKVFG